MVLNNKRTFVTNHAIERYVERTNKRFDHLHFCKNENCSTCKMLIADRNRVISITRRKIIETITDNVEHGEEDRRIINNSYYMLFYYETYGYDHHFKFIVKDKMVYVIIEADHKDKVVTVFDYLMHHNNCRRREIDNDPLGRYEARQQRKAKRKERPEFIQEPRRNVPKWKLR